MEFAEGPKIEAVGHKQYRIVGVVRFLRDFLLTQVQVDAEVDLEPDPDEVDDPWNPSIRTRVFIPDTPLPASLDLTVRAFLIHVVQEHLGVLYPDCLDEPRKKRPSEGKSVVLPFRLPEAK